MQRISVAAAFFVMIILLGSGCDKGLAPLNEPSGFSGVIRFKNWPAPDSVKELRLVIFQSFPTDSANIFLSLISGKAVVYPPVGSTGFPKFQDSISYQITTQGTTLQTGVYGYVVLAQRYGNNFFSDWRPAGVYTAGQNTFTPAPVRVLLHRVVPGIDFTVDFNNLPPKPWK